MKKAVHNHERPFLYGFIIQKFMPVKYDLVYIFAISGLCIIEFTLDMV
jgi:hypothetical protein